MLKEAKNRDDSRQSEIGEQKKLAPWERYQKPQNGRQSHQRIPAPDEPLIGFTRLEPETPRLVSLAMRSGQELQFFGNIDDLKSANADYEAVQVVALRDARVRLAGMAFLFWFVPAAVTLALGLGSRWVVRGFKKEAA